MWRPCKFLLLPLLAAAFSWASAQNIVPNPSFETNSGCPSGPCQWQRATSWNNLNMLTGCGSYGTPDYFHTCGSGFSQLPNNGFLTLTPHTGNAVMGFLTWSGSLSPNFREMVSCRLTTPMVSGLSYTVSFWICNAYSPYYGGGSNHVGLDFSTTPLAQGGSIPNLVTISPTTPEYEIPTVFFSNPWVNYTFNITATANWEYITFGNFFNDASTTAVLYDPSAEYFRCYYFIDDVSITPAVILPLQLGTPTVQATDRGSAIAWTAQAEDGIVRYDVERSAIADAGFERVAHTEAVGQGDYLLEDPALHAPGTWYYRVRATDAAGQTLLSEVVAFEFEPQFPLISALSPSPLAAGHSLQLKAWMPRSQDVELGLFDLKGQRISSFKAHLDAGENALPLPTDQLAPGAYLLRLHARSGVASMKFVVAE